MENTALKRDFARGGVLVTAAEWPLLQRFFVGDVEAAESLLERDSAAERLFATLESHGMGGWLLERLPETWRAEAPWRASLQRGAAREFAACALRRHALQQLDLACRECAAPPIVLKGAANAILYYPRESLRPSHDIDVLLHPEDAARCFPRELASLQEEQPAWGPHHHAAPFALGGYEIELHHFLLTAERWGQYSDLCPGAVRLLGFDHLHGPNPVAAATIALLHFNFHVGSFTYDFHDLDRIVRHEAFSWTAAESHWRTAGIVAYVLPALAVFAALGGPVPAACWERLYAGLALRQRMEVAMGLRLLASPRFSRLRKDWFCTRATGWPLLQPLARRIAGSRALTREQTGRDEADPRFWVSHYVGLPARRLLQFWR